MRLLFFGLLMVWLAESQPLPSVVDGFFSFLGSKCSAWTALWTPNATFYHPKFGSVRGLTALANFCQTFEKGAAQTTFRADGDALITQVPGLIHVLIPYVYGAPLNGADDPPFVNSGWESFHLVQSASGSLQIASVTEFFNSNRTKLV
jgi:hypothetical protein